MFLSEKTLQLSSAMVLRGEFLFGCQFTTPDHIFVKVDGPFGPDDDEATSAEI